MAIIPWFDYKKKKIITDIYFSNRHFLNLSNKEAIQSLNDAWMNFFITNSPNGQIFKLNSYKKDFKKIRLAHLTPSLNEIIISKNILASGGGLGAAIYCSPIHSDNTINNIFEQYLYFQLPKHTNKKIDALYIELHLSKKDLLQAKEWGVDYTLFGDIHCSAWRNLKKNINSIYCSDLEKNIVSQINNNSKLINKFVEYNLENMSDNEFKKNYQILFKNIPSLRFILYEVLAEYILLYQNNNESGKYLIKGELYNLTHKKIISYLCPTMLRKFNMKNFFIPINVLTKKLSKSVFFKNFDTTIFLKFLKWRIGFYIKKITINPFKKIFIHFKELEKKYPLLVGQILYREFYDKNLFEIERSKILYKMWQKERLICPIYSILPKGEVGINPYLDKLGIKYNIFLAKFDPITKKITKSKRLNITLVPKIISKSKSTIR